MSDAPATAADGARGPWRVVVALGITQITAWGSIYYVIGPLLAHLQRDLDASQPAIVGAFSVALLVSGVLAPIVGRRIDRVGGRLLMTAGSIGAGIGLVLLGQVRSLPALYAVWTLLGVAMAATLYEPAFAVITRLFALNARRAITVLTLFGGFASTVFWPLAQWLIERTGWRDAVALLGLANLLLCAPLHAWLLPGAAATPPRPPAAAHDRDLSQVLRTPAFYLLCGAFTANALVFSAMAVHLLPMLAAKGMTALQAAAVGALVGPMQVAGRLVEMLFGSRFRPTQVGLVSMAMLPAALLLLQTMGPVPALFVLFAFLYGAGNGVTTIVRGTVPAEVFGRSHYGAVNGAMAAPVLIAKACGPLAAALVFAVSGGYGVLAGVLAACGAVSVVLFAAVLRGHRGSAAAPIA